MITHYMNMITHYMNMITHYDFTFTFSVHFFFFLPSFWDSCSSSPLFLQGPALVCTFLLRNLPRKLFGGVQVVYQASWRLCLFHLKIVVEIVKEVKNIRKTHHFLNGILIPSPQDSFCTHHKPEKGMMM